jgi:hypothetical protein
VVGEEAMFQEAMRAVLQGNVDDRHAGLRACPSTPRSDFDLAQRPTESR